MRIVVVIDETCFFHPQFLEAFLQQTKDQVVGCAYVIKASKKSNIERYVVNNFYRLKPSEIWRLGWSKVCLTAKDLFGIEIHSVKKVLNKYRIPYFPVKENINRDEPLARIAAWQPDVIVSSNPLFFGKRLLAIPKKCCLNRHSGLLPDNGGVWPGFQAVRKGETETGVSIHTMTPKIDEGVVLSQRITPIEEGDTLTSIYRRCFALSAPALLEALDKIRNDDYTAIENGRPHEYYTFPTSEQWKEFRMRGGRYA